MFLYDNMMNVW